VTDAALSALRERALARAGGARFVPGNAARLLLDGPEVFPAMLGAIRRAERWVHFENYIVRDDATGWQFADALAERAREGVSVRLLCDWFGSLSLGRRMAIHLRDAGVELRRFNPPRLLDLLGNVSRDHRKLVVTDAGSAFLGGLCVGDEWAGDPAKNIEPWRDTAIELTGPAVVTLDRAFERTWTLAGGRIPEDERATERPATGTADVGVVAGEPYRGRILRIVELLAAGAVDRIWITDAYLVAPRSLFQSLLDAARGGVDVRLLVPGSSDLPVVRNLTRIGYRELLRAGVRIFEWEGRMLHAKTLVADGEWCRVGSSNLNASSLVGNYELDAIVHDRALGAALEGQFRRDTARSTEVEFRPLAGPERLGRLFPGALGRELPDIPPAPHIRRFRERRRRTGLALRGVATAARRSVFAPVAAGLAFLGLLFLVLPRTMAVIVAALCAWLAVGAAVEAFRRRTER
jgi:cardiolipin synthase